MSISIRKEAYYHEFAHDHCREYDYGCHINFISIFVSVHVFFSFSVCCLILWKQTLSSSFYLALLHSVHCYRCFSFNSPSPSLPTYSNFNVGRGVVILAAGPPTFVSRSCDVLQKRRMKCGTIFPVSFHFLAIAHAKSPCAVWRYLYPVRGKLANAQRKQHSS